MSGLDGSSREKNCASVGMLIAGAWTCRIAPSANAPLRKSMTADMYRYNDEKDDKKNIKMKNGRERQRTSLTTRSWVLMVFPSSSWCCVKSISGIGALSWIWLIARAICAWALLMMGGGLLRGRSGKGEEALDRLGSEIDFGELN